MTKRLKKIIELAYRDIWKRNVRAQALLLDLACQFKEEQGSKHDVGGGWGGRESSRRKSWGASRLPGPGRLRRGFWFPL